MYDDYDDYELDNSAELAARIRLLLAIIASTCPFCQSTDTEYYSLDDEWYCFECGELF